MVKKEKKQTAKLCFSITVFFPALSSRGSYCADREFKVVAGAGPRA